VPRPRHLLVVVTTDVADGAVSDLVRSLGGEDAQMLVVAPASDISRLDWLTNADNDAQEQAASIADKTAVATPTANVEAQVGDSDPLQAIEDALRTFPADEILIITRSDDEAGWLEEGSGETTKARIPLPVTHVTLAEDGTLTPRT